MAMSMDTAMSGGVAFGDQPQDLAFTRAQHLRVGIRRCERDLEPAPIEDP